MPPLPDHEDRVPVLARHARLGTDRVTQGAVLLYPEGILELDEIAAAILGLCDGQRSIDAIAAALADEYEAPRDEILADAQEFLDGLVAKGFLRWEAARA